MSDINDGLGPLPVMDACAELDEACINVRKKYDLTTGEYLRVLVHVLNNTIGGIATWSIRHERHPDNLDKPGGWE